MPVSNKKDEKPITKQEIEWKNSRSFVVFGMSIICTGILQSFGFVHDFRMIVAHVSGLELKEWQVAAQQITKSTYLGIGPLIIASGIIVMALGRISDIGAAYKKFRGKS